MATPATTPHPDIADIVHKRVRDEISNQHAAALEADEALRSARDRRFNVLIGCVGALAAVGPMLVGAVLWFFNASGDARERDIDSDRQKKDLADIRERLEAHTKSSDARMVAIERAVIDNQVLIVESLDHLSDRIDDVIAPKRKRDEPETLGAARSAAARTKARKALFD